MKRQSSLAADARHADAGSPAVRATRGAAIGRLLLAGVLGVAHTQAFAPHDWWWLQTLSLAGLLALVAGTSRPRSAAATGFAFGLGWFLSGIWWLYISMHVYGEMPAWMAALAVLLFSSYLSIYPALAAGTWQWLASRLPRTALVPALTFGAAWGLSEWLRGVVFTGFPWLSSGYAHADGPLAGFAPVVGVYGIGALSALVAALVVAAARAYGRRNGPATADHAAARLHGLKALAPAIVVLVAGAALAPVAWTTPAGKRITVRLLQGNIAQDMKFEQTGVRHSIDLYRGMITAIPADLVVTPETAFPIFLQEIPVDTAQALRRYIDSSGTTVLFGAAGADSDVDFTNSLFGLGPLTPQLYRYDKHHLVPFGEFIPFGFRWFVDMMKMPLGDFRRGGVAQPALPVRDVRVAPNICYEDLFGEEIARTLRNQPEPANILANSTNLAWFGDTIALQQHLQISRLRALETRRPMLRATNTGMTAVVTPDGKVPAKLDTSQVGTLTANVQGMQGLTPYIRWGNAPVLAACALVLAFALWRGRRAGR